MRTATNHPRLSMKGIEKRFGSVLALRGADFELVAGEVHALFGANGAGKSTLSKIITGHQGSSSGTFHLNGALVNFSRPKDALSAGIGIVTQETALALDLPVWENILLSSYAGRHQSRRALREKAAEALDVLGFTGDLDLDKPCALLTAAQRQMVEIARAIALDAQIIVFDEPTAALSPSETARLFSVMDRFRSEGRSMVFVSHRLEEIFSITDRITVLRDGQTVATNIRTEDIEQDELIRLMVGRQIASLKPDAAPPTPGPVVLSVQNLSDGDLVRSMSFELRSGEILGLGGLIGSGRSETAELLLGMRKPSTGTVVLGGQSHHPSGPAAALAAGIGFLPEDRARQSIIPDLSVRENILLAHLGQLKGPRLRYRDRDERIRELAAIIELQADRIDDASLLNFSGGMQQKALIIRALLMAPKLLILDEPTKGVDIGSRATIYGLLRRLVAQGMAILLISSDFEELLALSHRIIPVSDGRSIGSVPAGELDEETLLLLAAPRSSQARQHDFLCQLEANHNVAAVWLLSAGHTVVGIAASPRGEELVPAGKITALVNSPLAPALASPGVPARFSEDHLVLALPVQNQRGHDMGRIVLCWDNNSLMDASALQSSISDTLTNHLEGQFRLKDAKLKEPNQ
jgi:ABC-type sugar transport system ATPase subunit